MRIIFVRHGHPNYQIDRLTELGHKQGEAVANRLKNENIDAFFSSSSGRARETCEHIVKLHGDREITFFDFMREIRWAPKKEGDVLPENGHPWNLSRACVKENIPLLNKNWKNEEPFVRSQAVDCAEKVAKNFDLWLKELGYTREGDYYRVGKPIYKTVLLTSHAGSSSAVISHIFNLPFPFVCHALAPDFTAVTVVSFSEEEGTLVSPKFEIVNDAVHNSIFTDGSTVYS